MSGQGAHDVCFRQPHELEQHCRPASAEQDSAGDSRVGVPAPGNCHRRAAELFEQGCTAGSAVCGSLQHARHQKDDQGDLRCQLVRREAQARDEQGTPHGTPSWGLCYAGRRLVYAKKIARSGTPLLAGACCSVRGPVWCRRGGADDTTALWGGLALCQPAVF